MINNQFSLLFGFWGALLSSRIVFGFLPLEDLIKFLIVDGSARDDIPNPSIKKVETVDNTTPMVLFKRRIRPVFFF